MNYFDTRGKLVIISLVLYMIYFFAPHFYTNLYSEDVLNLLFSSPIEPLITLSNKASWVLFAMHVTAAGLMFFRLLYAKYIYLSMVCIDILLASLSGIVSYSGYDVLILALLNMSDGVIIYLSFFCRK